MRWIPADSSRIGSCANAAPAAIDAAAPRSARVFSFILDTAGENKKGRESSPALVSSRDSYFFISSFLASFLAFLAFLSPFLSPFFISAFLSSFIGLAPAWDAARGAPLEAANAVATRMEIGFVMFSSLCGLWYRLR